MNTSRAITAAAIILLALVPTASAATNYVGQTFCGKRYMMGATTYCETVTQADYDTRQQLVIEDRSYTDQIERWHPYGKKPYLVFLISGQHNQTPSPLVLFMYEQQYTQPWCPTYDGQGGINTDGHTAFDNDPALLKAQCGMEAKPARPEPAVPQGESDDADPIPTTKPLGKQVNCASVKVKKITARVQARGAACSTARSVITRYVKTGKASGWQCLKLTIGKTTKATCQRGKARSASRASITGTWKR